MDINEVLFFDTETTGIPERGMTWDKDYKDYPHIVSMAWMRGGIAEYYIVRPEGWEIPDVAVEVHGITTDFAREKGHRFIYVMERFLMAASKAGLLCGHNVHFDTGMVKANILRELGQAYYLSHCVTDILDKGKRIDTMRPAMKWVGARTAAGRLKFPNLGELYARCFPGESFPAHDSLADTQAVARCLPVLVANGIVKLEVKQYDGLPKGAPPQKPLAQSKEDDTSHATAEKVPQTLFSQKSTAEAELLEQSDF